MLGKNNPQIDIFTHMIFERLIPKDHLLVLIDSIIDFSFVYDIVKDKSLDDEVPDDTTICHFRTNRMGEENFDKIICQPSLAVTKN